MTAQDLKAACDSVINNPALAPGNGKTHCNAGALETAQAMDCHEFDVEEGAEPLIADEMYTIMSMNKSSRWTKVDGATAVEHALAGGLGYAALPSGRLHEEHGHIATIYPTPMEFSGSLGKEVPVVANVGVTDAEEKESLAFPVKYGEPDYFIFS